MKIKKILPLLFITILLVGCSQNQVNDQTTPSATTLTTQTDSKKPSGTISVPDGYAESSQSWQEDQQTGKTDQNSTQTDKQTTQTDSATKDDSTTNNSSTMKSTSTETNLTPQQKLDAQLKKPEKGDMVAILKTDFGTIKFKLFTKEVPEMSKNFMELAKQGKFKNVPFHRVIKDFMIQTGDFTNKDGSGGYSYKGEGTKLDDEINSNLSHLYGTVSMANAGPDTNGSQFFIVTNKKGVNYLDGSYSIFGQVYEGMDIAEKIQNLQKPNSDKPSKTVNIKSVDIQTYK